MGLRFAKSQRFNPRSRVGSDQMLCAVGAARSVSIHAPAWGATDYQRDGDLTIVVSIHAPAWGATTQSNHS